MTRVRRVRRDAHRSAATLHTRSHNRTPVLNSHRSAMAMPKRMNSRAAPAVDDGTTAVCNGTLLKFSVTDPDLAIGLTVQQPNDKFYKPDKPKFRCSPSEGYNMPFARAVVQLMQSNGVSEEEQKNKKLGPIQLTPTPSQWEPLQVTTSLNAAPGTDATLARLRAAKQFKVDELLINLDQHNMKGTVGHYFTVRAISVTEITM
jgi:hypothetical protein